MKKKLVYMMLVLSMAVGLCACGEPREEKETEDTVVAETEEVLKETGEEPAKESETTEVSVDEDAEKERLCLEALNNMEVELLSYSHVTEEEAHLRSDWGGATLLTVGVKCKEGEGKYLKALELAGDCTEREDGKTVYQGYHDAVWGNPDGTYYLFIVTIGGHIDVNTTYVELYGSVKGTKAEKDFTHNIGNFETAMDAFSGTEEEYGCPSRIVKLKGHYYFISKYMLYGSSTSYEDDGKYEGRMTHHILIPLDCGANGDLTNDDITLVNNSGNELVSVLYGAKADYKEDSFSAEIQDVIRVEASINLANVAEGEETNDILAEVLSQCHLEIDDGDGNTVKLFIWK